MSIRLDDIPGLIPEKKYIHESSAVYMPFEDEGFNTAIDLMSQRRVDVEWDREKLAKAIYFIRIESPNLNPKRWDEIGGEYKEQYYKFADAIIAACPIEIVYVEENVDKQPNMKQDNGGGG